MRNLPDSYYQRKLEKSLANPNKNTKPKKEASEKKHICKVCGEAFASISHIRMVEERLSLRDTMVHKRAYILFECYAREVVSFINPTYEKFIECREYTFFIRFIEQINPENPDRDIELFRWVLARKLKSYQWALEDTLLSYVKWHSLKETIGDATTRTISFMEKYCAGVGLDITQYFELVHNNTIARHIREGNISPWFLFASNKGKKVLSEFNALNYERCGDILVFEAWEVAIDRNQDQFLQLCEVLNDNNI